MARLIPHSPPPRTLDLSHLACSECVVDCNDTDCIAEIDDRCTDQCVIVPCDNPELGDIQCPKGDCESTCGVPDPCSLVSSILYNVLAISDIALQSGHPHAACETFQHRGITCAQNSCSMSTCDDPDNCSLVNAVSLRYPESYSPILTLFRDRVLSSISLPRHNRAHFRTSYPLGRLGGSARSHIMLLWSYIFSRR